MFAEFPRLTPSVEVEMVTLASPSKGGSGAEKVDTRYGELLSTAERCQRNFAEYRIWRRRLLRETFT